VDACRLVAPPPADQPRREAHASAVATPGGSSSSGSSGSGTTHNCPNMGGTSNGTTGLYTVG